MPMATPEAQREYQRLWVARRRDAWFSDKSCVDCGGDEQLELDHVDPSVKVSHSIWSWSRARRDVELAKCVVRCRSCHQVKTVAENDHLHAVRGVKLTEAMVVEIRARLDEKRPQREIAAEFGVSQPTVSKINLGKIWA